MKTTNCLYCHKEFEYIYKGQPRTVCAECRLKLSSCGALLWYHKNKREEKRPKKRSDCSIRPCPWISCKHHMVWVMIPKTGNLKPDILIKDFIESNSNEKILKIMDDLPESCTLDVADRQGQTLENVGDILGITRERVRQIEYCKKGGAINRLRHHSKMKMINDFRGME